MKTYFLNRHSVKKFYAKNVREINKKNIYCSGTEGGGERITFNGENICPWFNDLGLYENLNQFLIGIFVEADKDVEGGGAVGDQVTVDLPRSAV